MRNIRSTQGQWLGDVAVQHSGSIESLLQLAVDNDVSPTGAMEPGRELSAPEMLDKRVLSYYRRNDIAPASSGQSAPGSVRRGIGNMAVNVNFIVG